MDDPRDPIDVWATRASAAVLLAIAAAGLFASGYFFVEWLQSPPDRSFRGYALILSLVVLPVPVVFTLAGVGLWSRRRWGRVVALVVLLATLALAVPGAFAGRGASGGALLVSVTALIALLLLLLALSIRRLPGDPTE